MRDDLPSKAASGVAGLDEILAGGFAKGALFLVEGSPGTGKTTLALQFLLEGADAGEPTLYITLSETKEELLRGAASHGWSVGSNVEVYELQPPESLINADQQQSLLYSSDLECCGSMARPSRPKRHVRLTTTSLDPGRTGI